MGFATLAADLLDEKTHSPGFWEPHLRDVDYVVNAAGLLSGSDKAMEAVHCKAPFAIYSAMQPGARSVLISAVGIDNIDTGFARHRRAGEQIAALHDVTILRPGLVLADTSYGGSSLARALAALPVVTPVVGDGSQPFNPIHASDLAHIVIACLETPPPPGSHDVGGPEIVTQAQMLHNMRRWLGLHRNKPLCLPLWLAEGLGRIGDFLRLGPISGNAVRQLSAGVLANPDQLPGPRPRGFSVFLMARPAGTQDLWHARLFLLRPLLRIVLAVLWLASAVLGLTLPTDSFLPLVQSSAIPDFWLIALARLGGLLDLVIALALFRGWKSDLMWKIQFAAIAGYTLVFSALSPALWVLPLGGLLKNLPLLILVLIHGVLEDER